ncbi:hypothetical protein BaRGS_00026124 [Batillaria attramentaria]|uniref:Uncharacterized protein n=1 Tax=Batillaria attramentaria TaxID=370345 RepID=A0ABD0K736_9CAEN
MLASRNIVMSRCRCTSAARPRHGWPLRRSRLRSASAGPSVITTRQTSVAVGTRCSMGGSSTAGKLTSQRDVQVFTTCWISSHGGKSFGFGQLSQVTSVPAQADDTFCSVSFSAACKNTTNFAINALVRVKQLTSYFLSCSLNVLFPATALCPLCQKCTTRWRNQPPPVEAGGATILSFFVT